MLLQRLQVAGVIWSRKPSSLILTINGHLSELGESVGGGCRKYSREVVFPICVFILKVFSYPCTCATTGLHLSPAFPGPQAEALSLSFLCTLLALAGFVFNHSWRLLC